MDHSKRNRLGIGPSHFDTSDGPIQSELENPQILEAFESKLGIHFSSASQTKTLESISLNKREKRETEGLENTSLFL